MLCHRLDSWICGSCDKQFVQHIFLKNHWALYHEPGLFYCTKDNCSFQAITRNAINIHILLKHATSSICKYPGCGKPVTEMALKAHQLWHSGQKPFRCLWKGCSYFSLYRNAIMQHIPRVHLRYLSYPQDPLAYLGIHPELSRSNSTTINQSTINDDDKHEHEQNAILKTEPKVKLNHLTPKSNNSPPLPVIVIRTISVDCTEDGCYETFPSVPQLNAHLDQVHGIYVNRCLQPGCSMSFLTK